MIKKECSFQHEEMHDEIISHVGYITYTEPKPTGDILCNLGKTRMICDIRLCPVYQQWRKIDPPVSEFDHKGRPRRRKHYMD